MTASLRSMIALFQKMFGDHFWENAILEATHWHFHDQAAGIRNQTKPPITQRGWTRQFNELFAKEYGLSHRLKSVFIDTYYNPDNPAEKTAFEANTRKLWDFAVSNNPFECKDIKIALTEIRELQNTIYNLEKDKQHKIMEIHDLMEQNILMNRTLNEVGLNLPRPTLRSVGPAKQYCLTNECYTPTEFSLFGVGICILGIMIGVVAVAWFKNLCLDKDDYDCPTPRYHGTTGAAVATTPGPEEVSVLPPTTKSSLSLSSEGGFGSGKPATLAVNGQTANVVHPNSQVYHRRRPSLQNAQPLLDEDDVITHANLMNSTSPSPPSSSVPLLESQL